MDTKLYPSKVHMDSELYPLRKNREKPGRLNLVCRERWGLRSLLDSGWVDPGRSQALSDPLSFHLLNEDNDGTFLSEWPWAQRETLLVPGLVDTH